MAEQRYTAILVTEHRRVFVPVPFDPDVAWGRKTEHHVRGTINGKDVRGVLEPLANGPGLVLGPAWRRDRRLDTGTTVEVMLEPEGPLRDDLADDLNAAFAANPTPQRSSTRSPSSTDAPTSATSTPPNDDPTNERRRITEVIALLAAGVKERPKPADG